MAFAAAIDVGGTFTDVAIVTSTGELVTAKTPTTRHPLTGVFQGLTDACERGGLSITDASAFMYGTTAAVNALLTRSGARVGLLTTAGFRQILHLARSQTPGPLVGWLNMTKPEPLADLADTREIQERILASGTVATPLDEAEARVSIQELVDVGITVFAVGLLHSYANPKHERRVAALIRELKPDAEVTVSSDVLPEYREYDRVATTVANAYVLPAVVGSSVGARSRDRDARDDLPDKHHPLGRRSYVNAGGCTTSGRHALLRTVGRRRRRPCGSQGCRVAEHPDARHGWDVDGRCPLP